VACEIKSTTITKLQLLDYYNKMLICQNQIQGLFKDFQGPHELQRYIKRTELNQTGTFIAIYKQVQFTFYNLTPSRINQNLELSEKFTKCINSTFNDLQT